MASASSSVGASPTGSGVPETPLSVKSAGASPPQSSSKHLHINLGNQFRAGGSLPNVNNNVTCGSNTKDHSSPHTGTIHSINLKVCSFRKRSLVAPILLLAVVVRSPLISCAILSGITICVFRFHGENFFRSTLLLSRIYLKISIIKDVDFYYCRQFFIFNFRVRSF